MLIGLLLGLDLFAIVGLAFMSRRPDWEPRSQDGGIIGGVFVCPVLAVVDAFVRQPQAGPTRYLAALAAGAAAGAIAIFLRRRTSKGEERGTVSATP